MISPCILSEINRRTTCCLQQYSAIRLKRPTSSPTRRHKTSCASSTPAWSVRPTSHTAVHHLTPYQNWLAAKLSTLRHISTRATDTSSARRPDSRPRPERTLTDALPDALQDTGDAAYLPLSNESAAVFDGILASFRDLSSSILRTLHFELRCHALFGLRSSFRGTFTPPDLAASTTPDAALVALATDLRDLHRQISTHLSPAEIAFVTTGLAALLDVHLLTSCTAGIEALNAHGSAQLRRGLALLYHNLLNLEPAADLPRAMGWLALFDAGPDAVVAAAREGGYGEAELTALVRLQYRGLNRQQALHTKVDLDDRLVQLRRAFGGARAGTGA